MVGRGKICTGVHGRLANGHFRRGLALARSRQNTGTPYLGEPMRNHVGGRLAPGDDFGISNGDLGFSNSDFDFDSTGLI